MRHDARQRFETIHREALFNGLGHLSLLSEPAFLQFQDKLWATAHTPKLRVWFQTTLSTGCLSVTHVFFFSPPTFGFQVPFPKPVISLFCVAVDGEAS